MNDGCAEVLGHLFYRHPDTDIAQCQGYAGLHLQLGTLAMGVLPLPWRERGGLSLFLGIGVPKQGGGRRMRGHFTIWPRGGPDGEIARRRRANRTRDPNLGYAPPKSRAQSANDVQKVASEVRIAQLEADLAKAQPSEDA